MFDLTPRQMATIERLFHAGFRPIAIPPYEKALCLHRAECAVLLAPVENGTFKLLASPTILVSGNLSVRIKKTTGDVFQWKADQVLATAARLELLETFRADLQSVLELPDGRQ